MLLVKKIRVYPTLTQSLVIDGWIDKCRYLYNSALQHRIYAYQAGKPVNVYDQKKELPLLKQLDSTWKAVPNKILADTLFRLEKAFKAFFKNHKTGTGFPSYKGKYQFNTITFVKTDVFVTNKICFPKGIDLTHKEEPPADYTSVSLTRNNGRYYACFVYNVINPIPTHGTTVTSIDPGLTNLYTTDTNAKQKRFGLKLYANYQKRIKTVQQSLSKKVKNSKRYLKCKNILAKTHERLANSRKDFLHKASTKLIKKVDVLIVGDIQVQSIVNSKKSNRGKRKSFYNSALSTFKSMLSYKGLKYGKAVHFVPEHYTSKTCSTCSRVKHGLTLKDRVYDCVHCGSCIDRDQNGAINIKHVWLGQFKPIF